MSAEKSLKMRDNFTKLPYNVLCLLSVNCLKFFFKIVIARFSIFWFSLFRFVLVFVSPLNFCYVSFFFFFSVLFSHIASELKHLHVH